jgi:ABC-type antimicrobial peptide transport system permease subunit
VEQRTGEIGVRMALGAQTADVLRLVVRQGMTPVVIGLVLGVAAALALGRLITAQLYEVSANNPALLGATSATLAIVALLACLIPARRASSEPDRSLPHRMNFQIVNSVGRRLGLSAFAETPWGKSLNPR